MKLSFVTTFLLFQKSFLSSFTFLTHFLLSLQQLRAHQTWRSFRPCPEERWLLGALRCSKCQQNQVFFFQLLDLCCWQKWQCLQSSGGKQHWKLLLRRLCSQVIVCYFLGGDLRAIVYTRTVESVFLILFSSSVICLLFFSCFHSPFCFCPLSSNTQQQFKRRIGTSTGRGHFFTWWSGFGAGHSFQCHDSPSFFGWL